jgi:predicted RNase H-like nuclease (RuvC/YqgF family)
MDDDQVDLLKTKIKMLKSRLTPLKSKWNKSGKERRKERAVEANIEHFTNELNEINKKSPRINRISNHIKMSETNDYKIFNKDSPVRKSPSKSPRSKKATKSILKKGGRRGNTTRKNKNRN